MSDPRSELVANVLRENGHNSTATGLTTDDLAVAIVGALDAAAAEAEAGTETDDETAPNEADGLVPPNPETPTGTGTEGGAPNPAQ